MSGAIRHTVVSLVCLNKRACGKNVKVLQYVLYFKAFRPEYIIKRIRNTKETVK